MTKLKTKTNKILNCLEIFNSISLINNHYYLFLSNHINEDMIEIHDNLKDTHINIYKEMIMGKKISSNDVIPMIEYSLYESNTVIDMWDDNREDILDVLYYTVVNSGSYYHVFKCLDNNGNSYSTSEPNFSHVSGANTALYQTSDGYRWKYMYSVSEAIKEKFATSNLLPVVVNTSVVTSAVSGSIDIIKIDSGGVGYNNYLDGTFSSTNLRIGGNNTLYEIVNSVSSLVNGYYTDCIIHLTSGSGSGEFKTISSYYTNSTGKYIVVNNVFTTLPLNGTTYQIRPRIIIKGDGRETINCVARALVNSNSSNSIYRIEILDRGENYGYCTATVSANAVVDVDAEAEIRPILSPYGGHGSNPYKELNSNKLCFYSKISNNESNTILSTNKFSSYGLLHNPLFSNVLFELANTVGNFIPYEKIYKINPIRLNSNCSMNTTSNMIIVSSGDLLNQIQSNDVILLQSSDGLNNQLSYVNNVINSTHFYITTNGYFSCTEVNMSFANITSFATISNIESTSNIYFSNVNPNFTSNNLIIGNNSGAIATINTISINDKTKGFDTFISLHKYKGNIISGSFEEDELVYQTSINNVTGYLHSSINLGGGEYEVYVSNQFGIFEINELSNTIIGSNSSAILTLTNKYLPEIEYGSANILYIETINSVERNNIQSETFRIIFEF